MTIVLDRIQKAREAKMPVINYGVASSHLQGVLKRTLTFFSSVLVAFDRKMK